jgi:hypothetical protein
MAVAIRSQTNGVSYEMASKIETFERACERPTTLQETIQDDEVL